MQNAWTSIPSIQSIPSMTFANKAGSHAGSGRSLGRVWASPYSDLNVNFVCLSVMDRQRTVNHFQLLFCAFASCVNSKTTRDMNHGQSNSAMATTRTKTTHGLIYWMARAIDITAWQSVDAICLCCLTHSACVKITGLPPLLTTVRRRLPVVHVKEDS